MTTAILIGVGIALVIRGIRRAWRDMLKAEQLDTELAEKGEDKKRTSTVMPHRRRWPAASSRIVAASPDGCAVTDTAPVCLAAVLPMRRAKPLPMASMMAFIVYI